MFEASGENVLMEREKINISNHVYKTIYIYIYTVKREYLVHNLF